MHYIHKMSAHKPDHGSNFVQEQWEVCQKNLQRHKTKRDAFGCIDYRNMNLCEGAWECFSFGKSAAPKPTINHIWIPGKEWWVAGGSRSRFDA